MKISEKRRFRSRSQRFPYQTRVFRPSTCQLGTEPLREGHLLPSWRRVEVARVARVGAKRWEEAEIKSRVGYLERQASAIEYYQRHGVSAPTAGGVHS